MAVITSVDAPAAPAAPRRRRWRLWLALMGLLALMLAGTYYLVTTQTYRLENGGYGKVDIGPDGLSVSTFSGHHEYQFPLRPGDRATFTFSVRNPGTHSVRVNEVVSRAGFGIASVRMNDLTTQPVLSFETSLPMRPVKLNPGDVLALEVTIKVPDVDRPGAHYEPCSGFSFESLPVRFTMLGLPREEYVPLGYVLSFVAPDESGAVCPT